MNENVEGMHSSVLDHLGSANYAAAYYVYSCPRSRRIYGGFDSKDLMAPGPAKRYRDLVLAPGGRSRPGPGEGIPGRPSILRRLRIGSKLMRTRLRENIPGQSVQACEILEDH